MLLIFFSYVSRCLRILLLILILLAAPIEASLMDHFDELWVISSDKDETSR